MIGEWSASFDILPSACINEIAATIAETGTAPYFDRQLSPQRKEFLRDYVEAQIVAFEAADVGTSSAWFYWTLKTEGGAFAEWDFLRGIDEGWFPVIPDPSVASQSLFGNCLDILFRADDNRTAIIEEFPDPAFLPPVTDADKVVDDDIVVSHGESLFYPFYQPSDSQQRYRQHDLFRLHWLWIGTVLIAIIIGIRTFNNRKRHKYTSLDVEISASV